MAEYLLLVKVAQTQWRPFRGDIAVVRPGNGPLTETEKKEFAVLRLTATAADVAKWIDNPEPEESQFPDEATWKVALDIWKKARYGTFFDIDALPVAQRQAYDDPAVAVAPRVCTLANLKKREEQIEP